MGRWLLLATVLAGCLHDSLQICGDLLCPADATCVQDQCIAAAAIAACVSHGEAESCDAGNSAAGVCRSGVCRPPVCGDGIEDAGEACDDGNRASGDGCTRDCDAIDTCPPIGTAPSYSLLLHQPQTGACGSMNAADDGWGVASCAPSQSSSNYAIVEGPLDGTMTPIAALVGTEFNSPKITPEGDRLFLTRYNMVADRDELFVSIRSAQGWSDPEPVTFATAPKYMRIGTPSRLPDRRMMILDAESFNVYEVALTDSTATQLDLYSSAQLGANQIFSPIELTRDGLRIAYPATIASGPNRNFYNDRANLGARFGTARIIIDLDGLFSMTMTNGCERVYVGALGTTLYLKQQKKP